MLITFLLSLDPKLDINIYDGCDRDHYRCAKAKLAFFISFR
ncbi:hypothetical protein ETAE_2026 [Edwardsiella piscicida]|uniref:Uncharacterized protein n=1 Tax=Edwardsiella piscicida TaxID=1263550 RepID=A0AAU8P9A8_EDWPI|nr:hypothetical protein ETAE_2026 [Edwardsiella tarda EIB202]